MKKLWEIFVPTQTNEGVHLRTRFHKVWDEKVREITGGLTICAPTKGHWVLQDGQVFSERMIPVRIFCTREEIIQISDVTAAYYKQKAVMFYLVTENVEIRNYE